MAFTTWIGLRAAIKDAIANHVAGSPCTGSYSIGNRTLKYRSFKELCELLDKTYQLQALELVGDPASRVSYGRHRQFR